jgi:hypothetical protein
MDERVTQITIYISGAETFYKLIVFQLLKKSRMF